MENKFLKTKGTLTIDPVPKRRKKAATQQQYEERDTALREVIPKGNCPALTSEREKTRKTQVVHTPFARVPRFKTQNLKDGLREPNPQTKREPSGTEKQAGARLQTPRVKFRGKPLDQRVVQYALFSIFNNINKNIQKVTWLESVPHACARQRARVPANDTLAAERKIEEQMLKIGNKNKTTCGQNSRKKTSTVTKTD